MDRKQAQIVALNGLNARYPDEGSLLEIFAQYNFSFPMAEYGNFMNLQMIAPGYVEMGSSPFHFKITSVGRAFVEHHPLPPPVARTGKLLLPSLKPAHFPLKDSIIWQPLLDSKGVDLDADIPILSYGWDTPDAFVTLNKADSDRSLEALHAEALEGLSQVHPEVQEVDLGAFKMLMCGNDFYTSEKILDKAFMIGLSDRLGTQLMAVTMPRKGLIWAINAVTSPDIVTKFATMSLMKYNEQEQTAPLSKTVFLVSSGDLSGIVRLDGKLVDPRTAAAAAPEKKKGFFGRLFGN